MSKIGGNEVRACVRVSLKPLSAGSFFEEHCDLQLKGSVLCSEVLDVFRSTPDKTILSLSYFSHYFIHPACASLWCARHCSLNGWVSVFQTFFCQ